MHPLSTNMASTRRSEISKPPLVFVGLACLGKHTVKIWHESREVSDDSIDLPYVLRSSDYGSERHSFVVAFQYSVVNCIYHRN